MWASETVLLSAVDPLSRVLAGWMAGIRRRERLFIGVELLLSPDVDLVLRAQWETRNTFSVVLHG